MGNDEKRGKRKEDSKEDQITGTLYHYNKIGKKKKMDLTDQDRYEVTPEKLPGTDNVYFMAGKYNL